MTCFLRRGIRHEVIFYFYSLIVVTFFSRFFFQNLSFHTFFQFLFSFQGRVCVISFPLCLFFFLTLRCCFSTYYLFHRRALPILFVHSSVCRVFVPWRPCVGRGALGGSGEGCRKAQNSNYAKYFFLVITKKPTSYIYIHK